MGSFCRLGRAGSSKSFHFNQSLCTSIARETPRTQRNQTLLKRPDGRKALGLAIKRECVAITRFATVGFATRSNLEEPRLSPSLFVQLIVQPNLRATASRTFSSVIQIQQIESADTEQVVTGTNCVLLYFLVITC